MTSDRPRPETLPSAPESLATTLSAAGWTVARVGGFTSTPELYDGLATALRLPAHFGRNLDALWDCLTDLDRPTALLVEGWAAYATAHPERWARIVAVLVERSAARPPFLVVVWPDAPEASPQ